MFYIVYILEKIIEMTCEIQHTLDVNLFWNLPIVYWTYYMADITSDYTGKWNTWLCRTFILMGETIQSYKP